MDISIPDEYAPAVLKNVKHTQKVEKIGKEKASKHSRKEFKSTKKEEDQKRLKRDNSPKVFYNLSKREGGEEDAEYVEADESNRDDSSSEKEFRPSVANIVKESSQLRSPSFEGSTHKIKFPESNVSTQEQQVQDDPWHPQESTYSKKMNESSKMSQQSGKYLESLDNFLDANMKTIADLIASKKTLKHEIDAISEEVKGMDKDTAFQEKKQVVLKTDISNQQEKQGNIELQIEEMAMAIEQVKDKIDEKCEQYEGQIDSLYDSKQQRVEQLNEVMQIGSNVENENDVDEREAEFHIAQMTERIVLAEKEIVELERLMHQNKDREDVKIDLIRDKTKLLNQLIRNEDIGDNFNTNISRDIYKIINTYKN